MKYKKIVLAAAMSVASQGISAGEIYNGKLMAMSGAGVAGADFKNGAVLNPALVGHYDKDDNFGLNFNVGVIASDEDELIDNADELSDAIDELNGMNPSIADAQEVIRLLEAIGDSVARVNAGSYLQASIPNKYISATFFAGGTLQVGLAADIKQSDIDYLNDAINTPSSIDTDELDSGIVAVGATVKEFGVSFAKSFEITGRDVLIGISPKMQQVETIEYVTSIADFDSDDFDSDEYTKEDSNFNLDLGAHVAMGTDWMFGAVLKNMLKKEYETVGDRDLLIEPQLTVGAAYSNSWILAEVDLDVNAVEDLVISEDSQLIRLGVELDAVGWAQVRLGYRHDLKDAIGSTASVGIGLSPFGVIGIDIAAVVGENDNIGGALQLGFNF